MLVAWHQHRIEMRVLVPDNIGQELTRPGGRRWSRSVTSIMTLPGRSYAVSAGIGRFTGMAKGNIHDRIGWDHCANSMAFGLLRAPKV